MKLSDYANAAFHLPYTERIHNRVSNDNQWIAWTWFGLHEHADVYAAPTDGSGAPIRLTDSAENSYFVSWTPDSKGILLAQDHDGDERYRLYRVEVARPCELTLLTDKDPHYFLRGGELHPNGEWLVYGANYDFDTRQELQMTWLWRQDLRTGERMTLARPKKTSYFNPTMSPDGKHVIYHRAELHPAGRQAYMVDTDGENDHLVYNAGEDKYVNARWFPDGKRVLVVADTTTHTRVGIQTVGSDEIRWVLDDPARNIENAFVPFGGDTIVVIEMKGARIFSSLLSPETGEERHLPEVAGNLYLLAPLPTSVLAPLPTSVLAPLPTSVLAPLPTSVLAPLPTSVLAPVGENEWVAHYAISDQPDDFVRVNLDEIAPDRFVSLGRVWTQTKLTRAVMARAEDFRWRSVDGLEIQGWLYRAQAPRGTVVYVHGGPTYHHEDRLNPEIQYYVQAGFNVFDPNYRGSTGFSVPYRDAIKKEGWGGPEQEDIRTGIEALIEAGVAEKGRVGITGTSYGGYSSWYAITHFPRDIIAAAAPICGMTDLVVDYDTTRPDLRPYSEEMMGGTPTQVPEKYRERSPINFVQNIRGELLIVQGMQDPNVTPENVRVVTARLQEAGVEYQLLAFEDEGHGVYKPKNQQILCERVVEMFGAAFELRERVGAQ